MAEARRGAVAAGWRFVLAGGANTLVTGALLAALSTVIDSRVAYTLVFAAGVGLSVILADRFVFGVRMDRRTMAAYVGMYLAVYIVGLAVVAGLGSADLPEYSSALVVLVTAPLTFVGGRILTGRLHRQRASTEAAEPAVDETTTDGAASTSVTEGNHA